MKIESTDALIVVDVQRDFCPGGALAVKEGDRVVPVINGLLPRFAHVVFTRDWHPADHCSFSDAPKFVDRSWPRHCVAGTPGAVFHPDLDVAAGALIVSKGTDADREAYSGMAGRTAEGKPLHDALQARGVGRLFVCGLATDYCVKATALDGVREGYAVVLVEDACRGVDVPSGSVAAALDEMETAGVTRCTSRVLV